MNKNLIINTIIRRVALSLLTGLILTTGWLSSAFAQDNVNFSFNGAGEVRDMPEWGIEVAWVNPDNIRQSKFHMGEQEIDVIFSNFYTEHPLMPNGELDPRSKAWIDNQIAVAAGLPNAAWALGPSVFYTDPWYYEPDGSLSAERWVALMAATKTYLEDVHGKRVIHVMPFNEPDWWSNQGTPADLNEILTLLAANPKFSGLGLLAPSTLCSCSAQWWYDQVSGPATHGTTHQLGGSADDYANFWEHVASNGDIPYNPEFHSLGEALYSAKHGVYGGAWWGAVLRPRGLFVKASHGQRLGYTENRAASSAAAVYRAPDGKVYGFAGAFERQGRSDAINFVSEDQDLYFNGVGPIRKISVPVNIGRDAYVHIDNVPGFPNLAGRRWKIVNAAGNKVLEVNGGSFDNGANIQTAKDVNADYQKWDIRTTGDGYYSLLNAATGKAADLYGWSLENGGNIAQWDNYWNLNQKFWIESAGNGYFYLRNAHSNLYMEDIKTNSKNVQQGTSADSDRQKWYFVPADPVVEKKFVAHYKFENSLSDSVGANDAVAPESSPSYVNGPLGQALVLNGSPQEYLRLPSGVANSNAITIAAWVKWAGGGAQHRIFDFGYDTNRYMYLTPSDFDGKMSFGITTGSWQWEDKISTDPMPLNEWFHVALTIEGDIAKLYINGELATMGFIYTTPAQLFDVPWWYQQNNFIGKSQWPDPPFNGAIDDFRIYNYALSNQEVTALIP